MRYELTITLKPNSLLPTDMLTEKAIWHLSQIRQNWPMTAVLEFTKHFAPHFHCVVELETLKDKKNISDSIRLCSMFGRFQLEQIHNDKLYYDYIQKDLKTTMEIVDINPVVYDDYNIITHMNCKSDDEGNCLCLLCGYELN